MPHLGRNSTCLNQKLKMHRQLIQHPLPKICGYGRWSDLHKSRFERESQEGTGHYGLAPEARSSLSYYTIRIFVTIHKSTYLNESRWPFCNSKLGTFFSFTIVFLHFSCILSLSRRSYTISSKAVAYETRLTESDTPLQPQLLLQVL